MVEQRDKAVQWCVFEDNTTVPAKVSIEECMNVVYNIFFPLPAWNDYISSNGFCVHDCVRDLCYPMIGSDQTYNIYILKTLSDYIGRRHHSDLKILHSLQKAHRNRLVPCIIVSQVLLCTAPEIGDFCFKTSIVGKPFDVIQFDRVLDTLLHKCFYA